MRPFVRYTRIPPLRRKVVVNFFKCHFLFESERARVCMGDRQIWVWLTHIKRTPSPKATRKKGRKAFVWRRIFLLLLLAEAAQSAIEVTRKGQKSKEGRKEDTRYTKCSTPIQGVDQDFTFTHEKLKCFAQHVYKLGWPEVGGER